MDDWIKEAAAGLIGNVLLSNKLRQTLDVRVLTPEEVEQQEEIQKRWYADSRCWCGEEMQNCCGDDFDSLFWCPKCGSTTWSCDPLDFDIPTITKNILQKQ